MDEIVKELNKFISFKETTDIGDVVLVAVESPQSVFYGVITGLNRDIAKKEEWWNVHMSILSVPPQKVVWTLRHEQFTGQETFTMDGVGRFMKALDFSLNKEPEKLVAVAKKKTHKKSRAGLRVVK